MSRISVQLENELTLDATRERVWELLTDVPQVVPCIPGGRLLEANGDSAWKAEVALDLGFTRVVFLADVTRRDLDRERAVLDITAVDAKGRSSAEATMTSVLSAAEDGTQVTVHTDLTLEGEAARFGPGIVEDVSYEIVEQMAGCIRGRLADGAGARTGTAPRKLSLWVALRLWIRGRLGRARRRRS
jgi:carbon monoxide dehydrogenase subunit G